MIGCCSKCGKLFETTQEEAFTPGVMCAPCYNHGECMRLALAHVDDGGGEDAPSMAALRQRVWLWLRAKGQPVDPESVRAAADTFVRAVWVW